MSERSFCEVSEENTAGSMREYQGHVSVLQEVFLNVPFATIAPVRGQRSEKHDGSLAMPVALMRKGSLTLWSASVMQSCPP